MKKIMIYGLIATFVLTGCNSVAINKNNESASTSELVDDNEVVIHTIDPDDVETIGEIIEFGDNVVHIMSGDIVEKFSVINEDLSNFYLGQTVSVTQETEAMYSLIPYLIKDFTINFTTTGLPIERVEGQVIVIDEDQITIKTEEDTLILNGVNLEVVENEKYEFEIISFSDTDRLITNAYNENEKMVLIITSLSRTESGELQIIAEDETMQYEIGTYATVKNFNMTDLVVGQEITVYPQEIFESMPVRIKAKRIDL